LGFVTFVTIVGLAGFCCGFRVWVDGGAFGFCNFWRRLGFGGRFGSFYRVGIGGAWWGNGVVLMVGEGILEGVCGGVPGAVFWRFQVSV